MSDLAFIPNSQHKDLLDSEYLAWKRFLVETERLSDDQLNYFELTELNRILELAWRTEGYARHFSSHGVSKQKIKYVDELKLFPTISKDTIRANVAAFTVGDSLNYVTTGGSTGVPFGFYRTKRAFSRELASKAYLYSRVGWREGDAQAVFRGLPIEKAERWEYFREFNELRMSSYDLNPERMERYWRALEAYQPQWIRCYPSSGQIFASWMKENGKRLIGLKGVLCASENLYGSQRRLFSEIFGGTIYAHYGNYELTALAATGTSDSCYHVLRPYGFLELVSSNGSEVSVAGAVGEIVGTSFIQEGTLMFRYRTVDYAILGASKSAEGTNFGIKLEKIEGRLQDFVVASEGRLVSMTALNMHDDVFDDLHQFQLEQFKKGEIIFRYIARDRTKKVDEIKIRERLYPKLGSDFDINFQSVSDIPITKRGKHRFLVQHLALGIGDAESSRLFDK